MIGKEGLKIKFKSEIPESVVSPLVRLRNKELELQGKLLEVRKGAEIIVAEARKKVVEVKRQAIEKAVSEAGKYYQEEIEKTKKEAEKIRDSVEEEIEQIEKVGEANLKETVEFIIKIVFPQGVHPERVHPEGNVD